MSKIIPFSPLIPNPDIADKVIAPPYDIVTTEEARQIVAGNPYSLLHITRAEVDMPPDTPEYSDEVYNKARENFISFIKNEHLIQKEASLFIYQLIHNSHIQTGVVIGASVDEYDSGLIKKHELTRKEKEDDRTRFAIAIDAHAEPVFLVHRTNKHIKKLVEAEIKKPPLYDILCKVGIRHKLWNVDCIGEFIAAFAKLDALYIADGHHRSATASRFRSYKRNSNKIHTSNELYNFFPAVVFPEEEVRIYRYDWDGPPEKRPLADVTMKDVMKLADKNGIMPPKSTWFAPKLGSGLFLMKMK